MGALPVNSLEDLSHKTIAFHNRGFMHDLIIEKKIVANLVLTDTQASALRLVAADKVDYAIVASLPAAYLIREYRLTNVYPVAKSIASVKYCYAVKKGNSELLSHFNEGLAILKQTGQYQAIYDKWLGVLEPAGVPWGKIVRYGSILTTLFMLALAGALLWSWALKKQVAIRTAALELEVMERQKADEELRRGQQQLVQADKMASLGILVSGVAHEINNPNALVLLNMPLLIDYFNDTRPIVDNYAETHPNFMTAGLQYSRISSKLPTKLLETQEAARKIKRIVDELKGFARRDENEYSELVDLNAASKAAVRLVENTIRKSTNYFDTYYAQNPPKIKGSEQRIEQVVVNLILNACQALASSDRGIFLSTKYDGDRKEVILRIRDEGEGIPNENLPHLTNPFFTTKRDRGGTGLGLSVSATIVKEHKGSIEFISTQGQGTTVILRFPAAVDLAEVSV
jgi:polar amino acid transport system substrate-binding protein